MQVNAVAQTGYAGPRLIAPQQCICATATVKEVIEQARATVGLVSKRGQN